MKKALAILLFVLAFAGILLIVAFAHSGRTDGDGGHYKHSDGSYHYHHGYPAHDHYDMDDDGDIDCPYDFDDKTGWWGHAITNKNPETTKKTDLQELFDRKAQKTETTAPKEEENADSDDIPLWVEFIILSVLGVIFYQHLKRDANKK